jgi:hypothetical protein
MRRGLLVLGLIVSMVWRTEFKEFKKVKEVKEFKEIKYDNMGARGLNNNNPLNIVINGDKFQGEIIPSGDKRFKQFQSAAYGYRAGFVTLGTYLTKYNRNTVEKIINSWAPPFENDTVNYVTLVEKWSGVPKDKVLTLESGVDYLQIVAAMSRVENGVISLISEVKEGFLLQNKITQK